jgi:hypothetical protein
VVNFDKQWLVNILGDFFPQTHPVTLVAFLHVGGVAQADAVVAVNDVRVNKAVLVNPGQCDQTFCEKSYQFCSKNRPKGSLTS